MVGNAKAPLRLAPQWQVRTILVPIRNCRLARLLRIPAWHRDFDEFRTHDPMAAKGLLRHTSVSTTLNHNIKDVLEVTENAMNLVEELFKPVAAEEVKQ